MPRRGSADVTVYVDVNGELSAARAREDVVLISLAPGETLQTLITDLVPESVIEHFRNRPAINLHVGLAQSRLVGKTAAQALAEDPEFRRFRFTYILNPLLIKHNGRIDHLQIDAYGSTA